MPPRAAVPVHREICFLHGTPPARTPDFTVRFLRVCFSIVRLFFDCESFFFMTRYEEQGVCRGRLVWLHAFVGATPADSIDEWIGAETMAYGDRPASGILSSTTSPVRASSITA
jgi:hypothetical protein